MVLNPVISKLAGKLVVLASASPRRLEILRNAGLRFEVVPSWFRETLDKRRFKAPHQYAVETAKQKALEVARRMPCNHLKTPDIVIAADTIVTVDGMILEKPRDKQDAYRMLSSLSGKEHSVFTGVAVVLCRDKAGDEDYHIVEFYEETKVKFAELSEDLLWEYIDSGEPMDKAGGYGIQALGGMLVEYVHGDFLNVVGFPLNHFCKQLDAIYNQRGGCRPPAGSPPAPAPLDGSPGHAEGAGPAAAAGGRSNEREDSEEARKDLDKIIQLMDGFKASKALFTACKLGLFDLLRRRPASDAAQVALQLQTSLEGTRRLLEACSSLKLLKTTTGETPTYENTKLSERFLLSDAPSSLLGYAARCDDAAWPLFGRLEGAVREGVHRGRGAFCGDPSQDAKVDFMKAMHSYAQVTARAVATAFDLSAFKTACDLGGCTGTIALEIARAHPGVSVTVFDLPAVVELIPHFHSPAPPPDRITFVAGDFFEDVLPKADLYILSRILHDLSDERAHLLLGRIAAACTPGRGLLLSEILLDGSRTGPSRGLLQALGMGEGRQRSADEYAQLLKSHAFVVSGVRRTGNLLDAMLCVKV
ncbi:probable bifunctional dTTP/UTP pyrophosphatase/methyltransferase protein [Syngnathoides biaculeatus]|uniref:probable bifunctional dTTP/UTP pyrophosphatase/methyltransferase protein n=1 Tax=Syngnathoides biaculeatus TaxID=300417 RepID=UPI002ADE8A28|nr:probable bifunctional dTTP/UTP pyrophosphatase/methyltransferase protein [Syngnathoides biaculeatus]XP_061697263.1 probable bifunctional dTTP/UTP pyrophosphatase/methyltransferase protein [Syngnathoides biaculeatus]XP_061697264.1 probable bifunctional dTTP/UTP pyrophosphatase/methyltransferase protein [Syngnathoides biaculeatus]XP_061697265.1 probable bifunctional dTTP/UTP pyrophosphatase/methyltransferase protein [Syngnathoides biaculeatus]